MMAIVLSQCWDRLRRFARVFDEPPANDALLEAPPLALVMVMRPPSLGE